MMLKTFEQIIKINDKDIPATIEIEYEYDDCSDPETDFDHPEDIQKAKNGNWIAYNITVYAKALGEQDYDSLCNCYVSNEEELLNIVDDNNMIDIAIHELKTSIKNKYALLKEVFNKGEENEKI